VQLTHFDITDETDRNFAFVSQEVLDRTASITFDMGDGVIDASDYNSVCRSKWSKKS